MNEDRFNKIAEYLAERYISFQEEKQGAVKTAQEAAAGQPQGSSWGEAASQLGSNIWNNGGGAALDWLHWLSGEYPGQTGFNVPAGIGGYLLGRNPLWGNLDSALRTSPFKILNDPTLQGSLKNPYDRFMYDLLKKYENAKGGAKRVGDFLYKFKGEQNIGDKLYRGNLRKGLLSLLKDTPELKGQFKTLAMSPNKQYGQMLERARAKLMRYANSYGPIPPNGRAQVLKVLETLRGAKTPEVATTAAQRLKELANQTVTGKGGRPAGYNGYTFDDRTRRILDGASETLLKKPKYKVNASSLDDFGRSLGKITSAANPSSAGNLTFWQRLSKPTKTRGTAGALLTGIGLPMLLDAYHPN
jgi:hypothetical protein